MPGAPFDLELIRTRAAGIRQARDSLTAYAALREDDFVASPEKVWSARYSVIVAVEAAAAIANHIAARRGRAPDSYVACFELLGGLGIIDAALTRRLVDLARLRNILVHVYAQVDDHRLHQVLREGLDSFDAYLAALASYVESAGGPPSAEAERR